MMNETAKFIGGSIGGASAQVTQANGLHDRLANVVSRISEMTNRLESVGDKIHGGGLKEAQNAAAEPRPSTYSAAIGDLENIVARCDDELRRIENGL